MKRIILSLLILSVCIGCRKANEEVTISKKEYEMLTTKPLSEFPKPYKFIDGAASSHEWQIIRSVDGCQWIENSGGSNYILVHYPKCPNNHSPDVKSFLTLSDHQPYSYKYY